MSLNQGGLGERSLIRLLQMKDYLESELNGPTPYALKYQQELRLINEEIDRRIAMADSETSPDSLDSPITESTTPDRQNFADDQALADMGFSS